MIKIPAVGISAAEALVRFVIALVVTCSAAQSDQISNQNGKKVELGKLVDLKNFDRATCGEDNTYQCHSASLGKIDILFYEVREGEGFLSLSSNDIVRLKIFSGSEVVFFKKLSGGRDAEGKLSAAHIFCSRLEETWVGFIWNGIAYTVSTELSEQCLKNRQEFLR